jgi:hypothetical protein
VEREYTSNDEAALDIAGFEDIRFDRCEVDARAPA